MGPVIVPRPPRCAPTSPKPSPWGEGAPVRTLGRMRGRFCTQPFLVEKRGAPAYRPNGSFLLPRWATRSPPHPSPPVTASPKGKPSQVVHPRNKMLSHPTPAPAKCESKSGHVHGFRNSPSTGTLRPTTPKRASGNERAIKMGVQGAKPPALFPPAFSGESRAPARSRAGNHVAGPTLRRSRKDHLPTAARQSRPRLPPNQKGRPQGLPFSPIPCYALVTVFRMPLPAVSLGLVSKPSFS